MWGSACKSMHHAGYGLCMSEWLYRRGAARKRQGAMEIPNHTDAVIKNINSYQLDSAT